MNWEDAAVKIKINKILNDLLKQCDSIILIDAGNGIFFGVKCCSVPLIGETIAGIISLVKKLFSENLPNAKLIDFAIHDEYLIFNFEFTPLQSQVKNFYIFRWSNRSTPQGISAPIYIIANSLDEAEKLVAKEDNVIAGPDNNWTGYKCIQTIALDSSKNLSLLLQ